MLQFSVVSINDEENVNATSSEILEDVLKQLNKLGTEKRNQILKKLKSSVADTSDKEVANQKDTNPTSKTQKLSDIKKATDTESVQDEVEILDLHEPKLGTYKRKRSEYTYHYSDETE